MIEEAENWLEQAKADLNTANNSFKSADYYACAFWCQQSVEKTLKALLIERSKELIKIHDLVILGRKCKLPGDLLKECDKLTHVYTEIRYADIGGRLPFKEFNKVKTQDFLKITEQILKWVEENI